MRILRFSCRRRMRHVWLRGAPDTAPQRSKWPTCTATGEENVLHYDTTRVKSRSFIEQGQHVKGHAHDALRSAANGRHPPPQVSRLCCTQTITHKRLIKQA